MKRIRSLNKLGRYRYAGLFKSPYEPSLIPGQSSPLVSGQLLRLDPSELLGLVYPPVHILAGQPDGTVSEAFPNNLSALFAIDRELGNVEPCFDGGTSLNLPPIEIVPDSPERGLVPNFEGWQTGRTLSEPLPGGDPWTAKIVPSPLPTGSPGRSKVLSEFGSGGWGDPAT